MKLINAIVNVSDILTAGVGRASSAIRTKSYLLEQPVASVSYRTMSRAVSAMNGSNCCIADLQVEKLGTLGPMAASERLRN